MENTFEYKQLYLIIPNYPPWSLKKKQNKENI